jgi:hypothetical protein
MAIASSLLPKSAEPFPPASTINTKLHLKIVDRGDKGDEGDKGERKYYVRMQLDIKIESDDKQLLIDCF